MIEEDKKSKRVLKKMEKDLKEKKSLSNYHKFLESEIEKEAREEQSPNPPNELRMISEEEYKAIEWEYSSLGERIQHIEGMCEKILSILEKK